MRGSMRDYGPPASTMRPTAVAVVTRSSAARCTRPAIAVLRKRKLGQQVRIDGPQSHLGKSGTPAMPDSLSRWLRLPRWARSMVTVWGRGRPRGEWIMSGALCSKRGSFA